MRAPPTQQDVARLCNVSRSTVAAVLRGKPSTAAISKKTRLRVLEAIRRSGYRPQSAASSLRTGRMHSVAMAIPSVSAVRGFVTSHILEGIAQRASELGYCLSLCSYEEGPTMRASLARLVRESRFDGVFFYGDNHIEDDPREQILSDLNVPFVVLEKRSKRSPSLIWDNFSGGRISVRHLLSLGYRRIAFVGYAGHAIFQERLEGYRAELRRAEITPDESLVYQDAGDFGEVGRGAVRHFFREEVRYDALVCGSDEIALGCIQALTRQGRRVPDDVAVVGYDDSSVAALANPPLTSVAQDPVRLGREAMTMLVDLLRGKRVKHGPTVLGVRLKVRESCGARRKRASIVAGLAGPARL